MPPNVNGVPHRRQDRDAGCVERTLPFASTSTTASTSTSLGTLYVTVTGTGERGDEAGTGG
jgi:hypothetical protein